MSSHGLPWYIVLLLALATWIVAVAVARLATRRRRLSEDQVTAMVTTARAEMAEAIGEGDLAAVMSPGLAAEFTTDVRPYANGVLAVGEDPGGHISLKGESEATEGDH